MKRLLLVMSVFFLAACGQKPTVSEPKESAATDAHPDNFIEDADVVELTAEAQRRAGIEVTPVRLDNVETQVRMTGSVQPLDSRVTQVRPLARGRVEQVLVRVGDRVSTGQAVVRFDNIEAGDLSSQVNTARAELQRLRIQQTNAVRQAERSRSLVNIGAVPAKDAENAEADARAMEEAVRAQQSVISGLEARVSRFGAASEILAPFSGVVTEVRSAPGEVVDSASVLLTITDLSRVFVEGQVFERDLGKVRLGQPARITVDAFPGETFLGRVTAISTSVNSQTRTAAVRCEVDNAKGQLRTEMFANLSLPTTDSHTALSVPADAVQVINRRPVVFVRLNDLHFEAREVETSGDGPNVEIMGGLKDGEPVVTRGAFQLKSVFLARQLQSEHEHDR
jgi:cobalt-zinc-cadmium efflux system membrane fusion protein